MAWTTDVNPNKNTEANECKKIAKKKKYIVNLRTGSCPLGLITNTTREKAKKKNNGCVSIETGMSGVYTVKTAI